MKKKKEYTKSRKRRFTVVCGSSGNMERWWWHKKTLQASFRRWWHGEKYKIYLISILGSNNGLSRDSKGLAQVRLRNGSAHRLIGSELSRWQHHERRTATAKLLELQVWVVWGQVQSTARCQFHCRGRRWCVCHVIMCWQKVAVLHAGHGWGLGQLAVG